MLLCIEILKLVNEVSNVLCLSIWTIKVPRVYESGRV